MTTTISVSEATRKTLQRMKLDGDKRSLDEVIHDLITEHRRAALKRAQDVVSAHVKKRGLEMEDIDPGLLE